MKKSISHYVLCNMCNKSEKKYIISLVFSILILTVKIFAENDDITTHHKKICKTLLYTVKYIQRKNKNGGNSI